MRVSLSTSLLLCFVLLGGLGCYNNNNVDVQPAPTPPRPACLIVKATYKTIYISGPKTDGEQLTINGKVYDLYKGTESTYTYDQSGRLVRELVKTSRGSSDGTYTYNSSNILVETTYINDGIVTQRSKNTILLNAKGYDDTYLFSDQGLLLTYKAWAKTAVTKVEANNLVYHSEVYDGGRLNSLYEFDRSRPGLPPIYQYKGVGDQNLRTGYLITAQGIPYITDGPAYRIDYHYVFDAQGRVKRQIQLDTNYPDSNWSFTVNPGGIGVTDFEYECQ